MIATRIFLFIFLFISLISAQDPDGDATHANLYQGGAASGDIICYCHCADAGLYVAGDDIYGIGTINLEGSFDSRGIFEPRGYEGQDISAIDGFKFTCNLAFPGCNGGCWAGGSTGTPN